MKKYHKNKPRYNQNRIFFNLVNKKKETIKSLYEKTKIQRDILICIKKGLTIPTRTEAEKLSKVLSKPIDKLFKEYGD